MKFIYLSIFCLIMSQISAQKPTTTVYFIRHCEKADAFKNPIYLKRDYNAPQNGQNILKTFLSIFFIQVYIKGRSKPVRQ